MLTYLRLLNERYVPGHLAFGPTHVVLGVNNFCNLHCLMCDVGTGNDETNFGANLVGAKTRSMPMEVFQNVVDQMVEFCPTARLGLAFTEPLAWAPLGEGLAYASARGIHTSVTTNGLLLPRRAEEIAASGCRELFVSLDGPEAVHDRIRRKAGSYARAVEGIQAIAALPKAPAISVFCTITEWNVGALRDFLDAMSGLPLALVGIIHNNFITSEVSEAHNRLHGEQFHATPSNTFESNPARIDIPRLSTELSAIARSTYPMRVRIQPALTNEADLRTYYLKPEIFVGRRCNDVNRILMIDADGEAIPVHGRCYRFPIANIRTTSLREIWNHDRIATLRRTLRRRGGLLPACSRCCGGFGH